MSRTPTLPGHWANAIPFVIIGLVAVVVALGFLIDWVQAS